MAPATKSAGATASPLVNAFGVLDRYPAAAFGRDRLLTICAAEQPCLQKLVAVIEGDVALAVRTIKAAAEVSEKPVAGVAGAVGVLGASGVAAMARRTPTVDLFERTEWGRGHERFRVHATNTRRAATRLADALTLGDDCDQLYAGALLHDIGRLVLMSAYPEYRGDQRSTGGPAARLREERHRHGGLDHASLGSALARQYGLPAQLADVIANHHEPDGCQTAVRVRLADAIAHHEAGETVAMDELLAVADAAGMDATQLQEVLYGAASSDAGHHRVHTPCPLSAKELAALKGLAAGKRYKAIAAERGITTSTVRSQLHSAYAKLGVSDRAQAVLMCQDRGWL